MRRESLVFIMCVAFVGVCFGQEASVSFDQFLDKVTSVASVVGGALALVLTEVFNKYIGAKKTNALLVALAIAIGTASALITFGVPNVSIASIFTISSALFAVWRKVQEAIKK